MKSKAVVAVAVGAMVALSAPAGAASKSAAIANTVQEIIDLYFSGGRTAK